jgi:hypothetical protein
VVVSGEGATLVLVKHDARPSAQIQATSRRPRSYEPGPDLERGRGRSPVPRAPGSGRAGRRVWNSALCLPVRPGLAASGSPFLPWLEVFGMHNKDRRPLAPAARPARRGQLFRFITTGARTRTRGPASPKVDGEAGVKLVVEMIGLEPTTSTMRT